MSRVISPYTRNVAKSPELPIAIRFAVVIECESDIFVQACMVVAICRRLISGGRLRYKYTKKQSFLRIHLGKRIVHVYRISRLLVIGN